jgi:hypothetical protein
LDRGLSFCLRLASDLNPPVYLGLQACPIPPILFVEMGVTRFIFSRVGLELQSFWLAGITDMHSHAWPQIFAFWWEIQELV